jgi:hypothetical protein
MTRGEERLVAFFFRCKRTVWTFPRVTPLLSLFGALSNWNYYDGNGGVLLSFVMLPFFYVPASLLLVPLVQVRLLQLMPISSVISRSSYLPFAPRANLQCIPQDVLGS